MSLLHVPICFRVSESSLGHGVIATLKERIASEYASDGEDKTNEKATFFKRFKSVG